MKSFYVYDDLKNAATAVRKLKFFLHPDKLPKDFHNDQIVLCRMLWDITADSWEVFEQQQQQQQQQ